FAFTSDPHVLVFICYLYCGGPPRYLHSFPTRRSSDLGGSVPHPGGSLACTNPADTHGAAPVSKRDSGPAPGPPLATPMPHTTFRDRKSTRLNSSHDQTSYAVFCLK